MTDKFYIAQPVQLKGGGIHGVICNSTAPIPEYGVERAYEVQWPTEIDLRVHLGSELQPILASNDEVY